jgi:hypothetical protein
MVCDIGLRVDIPLLCNSCSGEMIIEVGETVQQGMTQETRGVVQSSNTGWGRGDSIRRGRRFGSSRLCL